MTFHGAFSPVYSRVLVPTAVVGGFLVFLVPANSGTVVVAGVLALVSVLAGAHLLSKESGLPPWAFLGRAANLVTLSRLVLLTASFALGLAGPQPLGLWMAGLLGVVAWLTDLVDGKLARRSDAAGSPPRLLGGWLDAETDSAGFLLASWTLASFPGVPGWVILIGLYRYGFGVLFRLIPWNFRFPPWFQQGSRIVAAASQVVLGFSWLVVLGLVPLPVTALVPALGTTVLLLAASFLIETVLRFLDFRRATGPQAWPGLLRSLVLYHHQPFRQTRLRRFYRSLLSPGDLAFDVGAHVGNRVRAWCALGCRVVAFEPQSSCRVLLDRWFGEDPQVTVVGEGLGSSEGRLLLRRPAGNPTLASFSGTWIADLAAVPGFQSTRWSQQEWAPVTTLDAAFVRFGIPAFIKIDVEGFEAEVLAGLSVPVRALSVEFVPGALGPALACLDKLEALGPYQFNVSLGESMHLLWPLWLDGPALRAYLESLAGGDRGGDLYARLRTSQK